MGGYKQDYVVQITYVAYVSHSRTRLLKRCKSPDDQYFGTAKCSTFADVCRTFVLLCSPCWSVQVLSLKVAGCASLLQEYLIVNTSTASIRQQTFAGHSLSAWVPFDQ